MKINASMKNNEPYISFIINSRNDNYAGGALSKLQLSLDHLILQLNQYKILSEIVIIDWNPPKDKIKLNQALRVHLDNQYCHVRVIEVPSEIHAGYKHFEKRPIHGAVAFNVGIRRAHGKFVLPKVTDSFYSDAVIEFIANQMLNEKKLYRCERYDLHTDFLDQINVIEDLNEENFRKQIDFIHRKEMQEHGLPMLHTNAAGDFQLTSKSNFFKVRGYFETKDIFSHDVDGFLSFSLNACGVEEEELDINCRVYKVSHGNTNNKRIKPVETNLRKFINSSWFPHILKRAFLKLHRLIYGPDRFHIQGVVVPLWVEKVKIIKKMLINQHPPYVNDITWGLAQHELQEYCLTGIHK
jgi:hypothetical protein